MITCTLSGSMTYFPLWFAHQPLYEMDTTAAGQCLRVDPAHPRATVHVYSASLGLGGFVPIGSRSNPPLGPECPGPQGPLLQSGTLSLDAVPTLGIVVSSIVDFPGVNGNTPVMLRGLLDPSAQGAGVLSDHVFGLCKTTPSAPGHSTDAVALNFSIVVP